jgi:predicted RNA polymerase sigma factor
MGASSVVPLPSPLIRAVIDRLASNAMQDCAFTQSEVLPNAGVPGAPARWLRDGGAERCLGIGSRQEDENHPRNDHQDDGR